MKLRNNILLFFVTILFCIYTTSAHAQKVKGFLGKRVTAEFNSGLTYFLTTPVHNDAYDKSRKLRANLHPDFSIAYTIGKTTDIGFRVGYDQVKMKLPHQIIYEGSTNLYYANLEPAFSGTENSYQIINRENMGRSFNYQVFIRLYNKKYIAPVGFYQQISLGVNRYSLKESRIEAFYWYGTMSEEENEEFVNSTSQEPVFIDIDRYNILAFSYFLGNKKTFSNGVYINSGFELNVSFLSFFRKQESSSGATEASRRSQEYHYQIPNLLAKEIQISQLFEYKIGLGIIF